MYAVAYIRFSITKIPHQRHYIVSIANRAVRFGGMAETRDDADAIARDIVKSQTARVANSTLPRVIEIGPGGLLRALRRLSQWFEAHVADMNATEDMLVAMARARPHRRRSTIPY